MKFVVLAIGIQLFYFYFFFFYFMLLPGFSLIYRVPGVMHRRSISNQCSCHSGKNCTKTRLFESGPDACPSLTGQRHFWICTTIKSPCGSYLAKKRRPPAQRAPTYHTEHPMGPMYNLLPWRRFGSFGNFSMVAIRRAWLEMGLTLL